MLHQIVHFVFLPVLPSRNFLFIVRDTLLLWHLSCHAAIPEYRNGFVQEIYGRFCPRLSESWNNSRS